MAGIWHACLLFILLFISMSVNVRAQDVYINEPFDDLSAWKPLKFPKIDRLSKYSIVADGSNHLLKITTDRSASGLVFTRKYDIRQYPWVEWRWKVQNVFKKGNALTKAGDDYPVRIYILFEYDPKDVGFFEKAKYEAAKFLYGSYPPLASLSYIWANHVYKTDIIPNAYTAKAMMIIVDSGARHVGQWRTHKINVLDDYKRAFKTAPVQTIVSLAIMGDSDNTGEASTAYIDYIKVLKAP